MKLYSVILIPYGELQYECRVNCLGTYKTKEQAILRALEEYENDNKNNYYVANNRELEDFNENLVLQVFWRSVENYQTYYELVILELDVEI